MKKKIDIFYRFVDDEKEVEKKYRRKKEKQKYIN